MTPFAIKLISPCLDLQLWSLRCKFSGCRKQFGEQCKDNHHHHHYHHGSCTNYVITFGGQSIFINLKRNQIFIIVGAVLRNNHHHDQYHRHYCQHHLHYCWCSLARCKDDHHHRQYQHHYCQHHHHHFRRSFEE